MEQLEGAGSAMECLCKSLETSVDHNSGDSVWCALVAHFRRVVACLPNVDELLDSPR